MALSFSKQNKFRRKTSIIINVAASAKSLCSNKFLNSEHPPIKSKFVFYGWNKFPLTKH